MLKDSLFGGTIERRSPRVLFKILSTLEFFVKKKPERQNMDMVVEAAMEEKA